METETNTAQVEVSDIALAAALCASGFQLNAVHGDRRKTFVFSPDREADLRAAINAFQNRSLTVDARRYAEEMRQLKTLIFNG
jgi:hypothetical protein